MSAIVVGASSGLGLEISKLLADRGERVIGVSRRSDGDSRVEHVAGDASHAETVRRAVAAAGDAGLLINCAGVGVFGGAGSYREEDVRRVVDANLVATILFCDALFPRFALHGGTIVNVLSTAATLVKPNESVYSAAKWGARGYTEVLRAEAKGTKARVLAVLPGGMQTPFWSAPREGFLDPRAVAQTILRAIDDPLYVSELTILRT